MSEQQDQPKITVVQPDAITQEILRSLAGPAVTYVPKLRIFAVRPETRTDGKRKIDDYMVCAHDCAVHPAGFAIFVAHFPVHQVPQDRNVVVHITDNFSTITYLGEAFEDMEPGIVTNEEHKKEVRR